MSTHADGERGAAPAVGTRIPVRCGCPDCRYPAAYIVVDHKGRLALEIQMRHHGARHTTTVYLEGTELPDAGST